MDLYGISVVAEETGIHESSLRRWEAMGLITPARVDLGKTTVRVYSTEDIDSLKRVKDLINSGITLRTAFEWANGSDTGGSEEPS